MQKTNTEFTVYEAGLVVNLSLPYLGASPDVKVFGLTEKVPFGLLKIKITFCMENCQIAMSSDVSCCRWKASVKSKPQIWVLCPNSRSAGLIRIYHGVILLSF